MKKSDFKNFSGDRGAPTLAEIRLIEASQLGTVAKCEDLGEKDRLVSARLIVAVATNCFSHSRWDGWELHASGLMLSHARVVDRLDMSWARVPHSMLFFTCSFLKGIDLDNASVDGNFFLNDCTVDEGLSLAAARIDGQLAAIGATLRNSNGDAVSAQSAKTGGWFMDGATIGGRFDINEAKIEGQFSANNTVFNNPEGEAINAQDLRANGFFMLNARVIGTLDINSAEIKGQFNARNASFTKSIKVAINAENINISSWFMHESIVLGQFNINSGSISGQFGANKAKFEGVDGKSIYAQNIKVGDVFIIDAKIKGRIDISNSNISGSFVINNTEIASESGRPALRAQGMRAAGFFGSGSRIRGTFDLNNSIVTHQVVLTGAYFDHSGEIAVQASQITTSKWVMRAACIRGRFIVNNAVIGSAFIANQATFDNPGGNALSAVGVKVTDWLMRSVTVRGEFDINGTEIARRFNANNGARFENAGGNAVLAYGVSATIWYMNGAFVRGRFNISRSEIKDRFSAIDATFANEGGEALVASQVKTAGWLMKGAKAAGLVDLNGSVISGDFDATRAEFTHEGTTTIDARGVEVSRWRMRGAQINGRLVLSGANIAGDLDITGIAIDAGKNSEAVQAGYATVQGGVFIDQADITGEVYLASAEIHKALRIQGSRLRSAINRAVCLREVNVKGETTFRGSRFEGHIHASRGHFQGRLSFRDATFVAGTVARYLGSISGKALDPAGGLDVERQHRFRHHAIVLHEAKIDGRLVMPSRPPDGIVDLTRARCDTLEDTQTGWQRPLARNERPCDIRCEPVGLAGSLEDVRHIVLDGFEYQQFEYPSGLDGAQRDIARFRSQWLASQPEDDLLSHFNPQPWRQAAFVLRAMGYDDAAQAISIERRIRQRDARDTPVFHRAVSWVLHRVADYGFNPWKTVLLALALAISCASVFWAGDILCSSERSCMGDGPYLRILQGDVDTSQPYPDFNPLIYSVDKLLPLPDLGMEGFWRPNTDAVLAMKYPMLKVANTVVVGNQLWIGWILYVVAMLESILGAILIAIAVTGFTGLLTRDEK